MITFTYSGTLNLPNPELNDSLAYRNSSKIGRSMSGTLWVYKNKIAEEFTWNFRQVNRYVIQQTLDFFKARRGATFSVQDHEGNVFNAKVTGNFSSTDTSRGSCVTELIPNTDAGEFSLTLQKI